MASKEEYDGNRAIHTFTMGDKVLVKSFTNNIKWLPGVNTGVTGPLSYTVTLADGKIVRRHVDHIRRRCFESNSAYDDNDNDLYLPDIPHIESSPPNISDPSISAPLRRSTRNRRAPLRYGTETCQ